MIYQESQSCYRGIKKAPKSQSWRLLHQTYVGSCNYFYSSSVPKNALTSFSFKRCPATRMALVMSWPHNAFCWAFVNRWPVSASRRWFFHHTTSKKVPCVQTQSVTFALPCVMRIWRNSALYFKLVPSLNPLMQL
jgi:hypothetical protein